MKTIEVCLTPDLLQFEEIENKIVVVIDIFRATSCMVTAFGHGIKGIIPVAEVEECRALQAQGYLAAAERNGEKVEGFDLDNSPFSYMNPDLKDQTIAMTTSNGTKSIKMAQKSLQVVIGAFLNKKALTQYLIQKQENVLLLCAGWKGKVNLEDTFFAGAVLTDLINDFQYTDDACALARSAFHLGKNNPKRFLMDSSHYQRLKKLGNEKDMDFCITIDKYDVVPVLEGNELRMAK